MSSIIPPQVRSLRRKLVAATTTSRKSLTTFPLASYFSIHLLLSAFLLFSFGFLPRSEAFWRNENALGDGGFKQTVSADRPEHPFLTPITSDPFKTMVLEFIGVTFCMIWWSGHLRSWWSVIKANERRAAGSSSTQESEPVVREDLARRLESTRTAGLATAAAIPLVLALLLLLGVSAKSQWSLTLILAMQLSMMLVFPIVDALGIPDLYAKGTLDRYRLTRLFCELDLRTSLERATVYPVYGTLIGTWCGVIPMALDWDRPWQAYPLTLAFGSILGFIASGFASFSVSAVEEAVAASSSMDAVEVQPAAGGRTRKQIRKKGKAN
ncbi:hypothetical protein FFLO_06456 [Filobasidium floriforme]|uniref:Glycosylphosphatidylinositol anchor biosynthesis protein 11 n=1 Tax=Filobasidium floriforme TaxID=5210 RepID=A0A8K0JH89_9TREE|nr:hypothetical protein FFLO_06456 [Filobasidium floriforme]